MSINVLKEQGHDEIKNWMRGFLMYIGTAYRNVTVKRCNPLGGMLNVLLKVHVAEGDIFVAFDVSLGAVNNGELTQECGESIIEQIKTRESERIIIGTVDVKALPHP